MTRRRVVVVVVTLLLGTTMLYLLLGARAGDAWFYLLGLAQAGVWAAGGLGSGPVRLVLSPVRPGPAAVAGLTTGAALGAVFIAGALIVREIAVLRDAVTDVLQYADGAALVAATIVAVANAVGEEIFFRGAVYAAADGHRPLLVSTFVYVLATVATGNLMLVFAAATVGLAFGLLRRATGGVLAPIVSHVTWSLLMLVVLPRILPT